jgi:hypothetical protein
MRFRGNGFCINHNKYSMREKRNAYRILVGNPEGKRSLERPSRSRRILLKRILKKLEGTVWAGSIWLRIETCGGLL